MVEKQKSSNFQKFLSLFILSLGAGLIYKVPYLREVFYEPLRAALNVSNEQLGALSTMYGTIALFTYIPGGIIADKVSAKVLLIFSFISTGILTLWFSTIPSYGTIKLIYGLLAITTCLTFWSAFLKGIRALGSDREQGKMFGISEGIRSASGIVSSFIVLAIISLAASDVNGLQNTLVFYGVIYILVGILAIFLMPNPPKQESQDKFKFSDLSTCFKNPGLWLVSIVIFGIYSLYILASYTTPYLQDVILAPAVVVGGVGIIRQYGIGLIAAPSVGIVGDKIGSPTKTLAICTVVSGICVAMFLFLPKTCTIWIPVILTIVVGFMIFALRGVQYATMPEAQIPLAITGTATGIISIIGYLPDMYIYTQVGRWIDTYPPEKAYNMIFIYMIIMAIIVFLGSLGILYISKRKVNKTKMA